MAVIKGLRSLSGKPGLRNLLGAAAQQEQYEQNRDGNTDQPQENPANLSFYINSFVVFHFGFSC